MDHSENLVSIIAGAIGGMRIRYPDVGDGTTRDPMYQSGEDTVPFAEAILIALEDAGYKIVPKDE